MDLFFELSIPVLIFLSRVADVTLGTLRIILVSKSYKLYAAMLGFFEVLIWILAIGQIMENLTDIKTYLAYAIGFAVGTYVGIIVEEKIAIGTLLLQVISRKGADELIEALEKNKFRIATIGGKSSDQDIDVIYVIVTRKNYKKAARLIKKHNPRAFFTVEDISIVQEDLDQSLHTGSKRQKLFELFRHAKKRI